jgi:hypothetical protein
MNASSAQKKDDTPQKHRISAYLGGFFPSGKYPAFGAYPETKFESGGVGGIAYSYLYNDNFEIGTYLDVNYFNTKNASYGIYKTSVEITSVILGVSAAAVIPYNDRLSFFGGLKSGYASNFQTVEIKASSSTVKKENDGGALAISAVAGGRYKLNKAWEMGVTLQYTYLSQKSDGGDINLGGISLLISGGYSF